MKIGDLLNDLWITEWAVNVAEQHRKEAATRLIDGLALVGSPLKVGGFVVIGDTMVKRTYETLPLELSRVENIPTNTVVVDDSESPLNTNSDVPL